MDSVKHRKHIMIVAGEASGDLHGANLMRAYRAKDVETVFSGIGGHAMREEGLRVAVEAETLSVVGITEVIAKLPVIFRGMAAAKNIILEDKPDLLILIDFPDFNLRLAAFAKKHNVPVLYYISPQIWAWRQGRVKKMKRLVDHMAVILPFEAHFYETHGIPVTYVGHPLLDHVPASENEAAIAKGDEKPSYLPASTGNCHRIGFLPGSRDREVSTLLPVMLETSKLLAERLDISGFYISHARSVAKEKLENVISAHISEENIHKYDLVSGGIHRVLDKVDFVIAASGTVTLEAAMALKPMIIIYKVSPLSYWLGRALIRVDHIGLVNLIAEERVVPELIQAEANPEAIAETVTDILKSPERVKTMHDGLLRVKNILGGPGASAKAADIAFAMLERIKNQNTPI